MLTPNRKDEVQLGLKTEDFGSEQDEAEYVAWLNTIRHSMRQPQPHHNSIEEFMGE